jgi:hypothetical protein
MLVNQPPALAPYPPLGHHPSDPSTVTTLPPPNQCKLTLHPNKNTIQSKSLGRLTVKQPSPLGRSAAPLKAPYSIFTNSNSMASTLSLTQSSSISEPSHWSFLPDESSGDRATMKSGCSLSCSAGLFADDYPPIANSIPRNASPLSPEGSPFITASAARRASHEAHLHANKKSAEAACLAADLAEVQQQKARFQEMEARILVLTQGRSNYEMGDREEETATMLSPVVGWNRSSPRPIPLPIVYPPSEKTMLTLAYQQLWS